MHKHHHGGTSAFDRMTAEERAKYTRYRAGMKVEIPGHWQLTDENYHTFTHQAKAVAFDIETLTDAPHSTPNKLKSDYGLSYLTEITFLSMYTEIDGVPHTVVLSAPLTNEEVAFVNAVFCSGAKIIAHNMAFDIRLTCGHHDIMIPADTYCTIVGETVLRGAYSPAAKNPKEGKRGLDDLLIQYDYMDRMVEFEPRCTPVWYAKMKKSRNKLHTLPPSEVGTYVAVDSWAAYKVWQAQMRYVALAKNEYSYDHVFHIMDEDQQVQNEMFLWSVRGFPLNYEFCEWSLDQIATIKARLQLYFAQFGVGACTTAAQKKDFLFNVLGLTPPTPPRWVEYSSGRGAWKAHELEYFHWTKTAREKLFRREGIDFEWDAATCKRYWATDSDALDCYYRDQGEDPRIELLSYYTKILSVEDKIHEWMAHANYDGCAHSLFQNSTNTGRVLSKSPNGQNNPMGKQRSQKKLTPFVMPADCPIGERINYPFDALPLSFSVRGMIRAPKGFRIYELDASNAELRFQAIYARDQGLCQAFADGVDVHSVRAAGYYGARWDEANASERYDLRTESKGVTFGGGYGLNALGVGSKIGMLEAEVYTMLNNQHKRYPGIKRAQRRSEDFAKGTVRIMSKHPLPAFRAPYIQLWNGRHVPLRKGFGNWKWYTAFNGYQQGGVGAVLNDTVLQSREFLRKRHSFIWYSLHDALYVACPEDDEAETREVGEFVSSCVMTAIPYALTVIDGIHVPWPSGCKLGENADKAGYVFDCNNVSEGVPMPEWAQEGEIAYDQGQAWMDLLSASVYSLDWDIKELKQDIALTLRQGPGQESLLWYTDNGMEVVQWSDVCTDIDGLFAQCRVWGHLLTKRKVHKDLQPTVKQFRRYVLDLEGLYQELAAKIKKRKEHSKLYDAWEREDGGEAKEAYHA